MYHHKEMFHLETPLTYEETLALIPEGKFIAVFGTSHTKGCCELNNREVTHIDREYIWPSIVADGLNYPYVNFAVPGNTNELMVQQIIEFLELPNVKERCVLVLAEVRLGDISGSFPVDMFTEDFPNLGITGSLLAGGYCPDWHSALNCPFVPKPQDDDYVKNLLININEKWEKYDPPQSAIDELRNVIDTHIKTALTTSSKALNDWLYIRTMRALIETNNIPFRFFMWDQLKVSNTPFYRYLDSFIQEKFNIKANAIQLLLPNVNEIAPRTMGKDIWHTTECECGHRNHVVHEWVANEIIEELKNDFRG